MRKSKKSRSFLFVTLILIFLVTSWYHNIFNTSFTNKNHDNSKVEIHMIDVGQSESILIIQGDKTMLIDTGIAASENKILDYLAKSGIKTIDYMVITHFHRDHAGSARYVVDSVNVKNIICMDPEYFTTWQERFWYTDLKISMLTNGIFKLRYPKILSPYDENGNLKSFYVGDAKYDILLQDNHTDNVNNKSIISKLSFKDFSILFMSDAEFEVEEELLDSDVDVSADVLKVGHHGSHTSSLYSFLKAVNPSYALISCGKNNKYGHPHSSVMNKLARQNIEVYRTDINGDVVVISDGKNIDIKTEK